MRYNDFPAMPDSDFDPIKTAKTSNRLRWLLFVGLGLPITMFVLRFFAGMMF